jgi:hypothetical protein
VHPTRFDVLQVGEEVGVEGGLQNRLGFGRPSELGVDDLIMRAARTRLTVGCGQEIGP